MVEFKQVIVARTDLGMGKGKLAAQAAHASLAGVEECMKTKRDWYEEWKDQGQAKVVVRAGSDAELVELLKAAKAAGIPSVIIHDRGLTQLEPGTATCLAVGPAPSPLVDKVTGQLRLL